MDMGDFTMTNEVLDIIELFDRLDGEKQLELLSALLEKMANGEVELKGNPIYPEEIGIDDSFACCSMIMYKLCRY